MNSTEKALTDIELLGKILRRNRNFQLVSGLLIAGIALFIIFGRQPDRFIMAVSLLSLLGGTALFVMALIRYDVSKSELFRLIETEPEKIVWVYYYQVQMMPFGVSIGQMCTLFFRLSNREKILLRAGETEIIALMNSLRSRLPHTTFGHSSDKEQLYRANPDLLRR